LNISQYSPQSISQGRGDIEFSLSRIPTAQAPSLRDAVPAEARIAGLLAEYNSLAKRGVKT